jgi:hypothetical protein
MLPVVLKDVASGGRMLPVVLKDVASGGRMLPVRGVESETDNEEGQNQPSVVITDPFTRQDSVDQQKADKRLRPLFEAAIGLEILSTLFEVTYCMGRTYNQSLTRHLTR